MATNKTLAPTNVTVQIPALSDVPDMSVPANAIDKTIDAVNVLNSQLGQKFNETRMTSMSDLLSYISTQKIGITRVDNTVGALLGNYSRQGICLCCEISSEYDSYIFLDSNGDTYSGWITIATGAVTKNKL